MVVIKSHNEFGRMSATALAEPNAIMQATTAVVFFIAIITLYSPGWRAAEYPYVLRNIKREWRADIKNNAAHFNGLY
ncbi:hypothetical protein GCM10011513_16700 [Franconibacter daqui]|uniref:hypothetical protein n=1 Tax=Franconibacter daqui TaxID=2047724 RepID=UPI00166B36FF|nr:hypothetical protein [Franconibacter daqui]GGD19889.1 hypothetical protein GCM10011513_16700 [Franconibacter daqui]